MIQSENLLDDLLLSEGLSTSEEIEDFWRKSVGDNLAVTRLFDRYSQNVPVNPRVIFYEAMAGSRMGDNPYAIFEYLRSHPEYGEFVHVWSFDKHSTIPEKYRGLKDVAFAAKGSAAFSYFLATAGYVVCNANLPGFYAPRPEQKYLNTWHGIPYKKLGRDSPKARWGAPRSTASFLKATHVITTCEFMTQSVISAYSMAGTSNAIIAETGYPRVDITVNKDADRMQEIRETVGLAVAGAEAAKPVVLYAPTWRAEEGEDVVDTDQLVSDLRALAALDIVVLYRGHHRMDRIIQDQTVGDELSGVLIPSHDISSNELLTVVDVLITDYSSIFFDFLPTGRPIVQYLYDFDEYARTRGLNLTIDELPGSVAFTREDFVSAVEEAASLVRNAGPDSDWSSNPLQGSKYAIAQQRFCSHEDGHASKRAADFLFGRTAQEVPVRVTRDARPTIVFWGGCPGEETPADEFFHEVIASGKHKATQTTMLSDRSAHMPRGAVKAIKALRGGVSTIAYTPVSPALQPSETEAYAQFVACEDLAPEQVIAMVRADADLHRIFEREYRRRLGRNYFDTVVLDSGLSNYEVALASMAGKCIPLSEFTRARIAREPRFRRSAAFKWGAPRVRRIARKLARALPAGMQDVLRGRR
ncbi:CDP-glycerol glycerophosphotransferase family protein [Timonella senegalensis]|uniref:CDP-glycerol glycerophosphotransferase family protein n=1 Tax=Timonella senegalensis TaxID=1465825 RepID=UPI0002F60A1D|nr:CDP-glycerol glycerophosphotransferase family protein [Timonella senegalensis]